MKITTIENMIDWSITKDEAKTIDLIVKRAKTIAPDLILDGLNMDITACHLNGNPIDLDALLAADDANFGHDVFGIIRYIDRTNGKLTDCFSPRFSKSI